MSFRLYLYSFCYDVHITFRVVCYKDYLKEHRELDDGNFEKHWNSRTKAEKKVQNILSMFYLVSCSIDINQALSIVTRKHWVISLLPIQYPSDNILQQNMEIKEL